MVDSVGVSKSNVSSEFVEHSGKALERPTQRLLDEVLFLTRIIHEG